MASEKPIQKATLRPARGSPISRPLAEELLTTEVAACILQQWKQIGYSLDRKFGSARDARRALSHHSSLGLFVDAASRWRAGPRNIRHVLTASRRPASDPPDMNFWKHAEPLRPVSLRAYFQEVSSFFLSKYPPRTMTCLMFRVSEIFPDGSPDTRTISAPSPFCREPYLSWSFRIFAPL